MRFAANDPCSCGSGREYRYCCGMAPDASEPPGITTSEPASIELEGLIGLFHAGDFVELEIQSLRMIERFPESGLLWKLLCAALQMQDKDALSALERAAALLPEDPEALNNLADALQSAGRLEEAVRCYQEALRICPDEPGLHNSLGTALQELGRMDEAASSYRQALMLAPEYADAHNNLGTVLHELGQFDAAVASHCRALAIRPDYEEAHRNAGHLLLALGQLDAGFREYAWRETRNPVGLQLSDPSGLLPLSLEGKRVLLCFEQGLGDELFFLRFVPQLREKVSWIGYLTTPKIRSLVERSGCFDQVFGRVGELPAADYIIPVGDLPLLLKCDSIAAIPPPLKMRPTMESQLEVRQRLEKSGWAGQQLLGLTWRGGMAAKPGKGKVKIRHIELDQLTDSIREWKGALAILQRNPLPEEIEYLRREFPGPVYDFSDCNDDLEQMLALLNMLEKYVGIGNSNMPLVAGLGKTACVLIKEPANWLWMEGIDESPWFAGFKLYRQSFDKGWGGALASIKNDIMDHQQFSRNESEKERN